MLADYTLQEQRKMYETANQMIEEGFAAEDVADHFKIDDGTARELCYVCEHGQKRGRYKMEDSIKE